MVLTTFSITNFRCLDQLTINLSDYASLIGPNNAGKSSILAAIQQFLQFAKPSPSDWKNGEEQAPLILEGTFEDLTDWERRTQGVSGLVYDNKIQIRITNTLINPGEASESIQQTVEAYTCDEEFDGYSDKWGDLADDIKERAAADGITSLRSNDSKERVKAIIREHFPDRITRSDPRWSDDSISINAALKQALPQDQLIPAVRDATDDAKPASTTSFGRLLKNILLPAITDCDEYRELLAAVDTLHGKLQGDNGGIEAINKLSEDLSGRVSSLFPATVSMALTTPNAEKFVGGSTTLRINDGVDTPIHQQGHGVQRALVFALLEYLATHEAASGENARSTVLLFEEPELYLHPHVMRRLRDALQAISQKTGWQVIVTTHSPFLVNVADDPQSLIILQRPDPACPPRPQQLDQDPFQLADDATDERSKLRAVLDFDPSVCEAFFAKRAVLVEGPSEIAVLQQMEDVIESIGLDEIHARDTTVISCDGKLTIRPIARLLDAFEIPIRIIHDEDRHEKSDQELAENTRHPYHENKRIQDLVGAGRVFVVKDTLEHLLWPDPNNRPHITKDKPYRAWSRFTKIKDSIQEDEYADLVDLFRFAFNP